MLYISGRFVVPLRIRFWPEFHDMSFAYQLSYPIVERLGICIIIIKNVLICADFESVSTSGASAILRCCVVLLLCKLSLCKLSFDGSGGGCCVSSGFGLLFCFRYTFASFAHISTRCPQMYRDLLLSALCSFFGEVVVSFFL